MVVGFTTTCAIGAYHHLRCEFEPRSWRGVLDTKLGDKSLSVTCDRSVVSSTNKTEILLKLALKHHKPPNHFCHLFFSGFLCPTSRIKKINKTDQWKTYTNQTVVSKYLKRWLQINCLPLILHSIVFVYIHSSIHFWLVLLTWRSIQSNTLFSIQRKRQLNRI